MNDQPAQQQQPEGIEPQCGNPFSLTLDNGEVVMAQLARPVSKPPPPLPPPPVDYDFRHSCPHMQASRDHLMMLWNVSRDPEIARLLERNKLRVLEIELLRGIFGDIAECWIFQMAWRVHQGDTQAESDWDGTAKEARELKRWDTYEKMAKSMRFIEKWQAEGRQAYKKWALSASLFAIGYFWKNGQYPTKYDVRSFLKSENIPFPEGKNENRMWKGSVLRYLRTGKPGPKNPPQGKNSG